MLVDVRGRALCARIRGKGPAVVLDCGGAGAGVDGGWGPDLEALLAESHTVVSYDRAGSGQSGGDTPGTVAEMADDLRELLRGLEIRLPAVFVGWSFDALVTQVFATRHPEDVAGLVFVDPTPTGQRPGSKALQRAGFAVTPLLLRMSPRTRELGRALRHMRENIAEATEVVERNGLPAVRLRVLGAGVRPRLPRAQAEFQERSLRELAARSPLGEFVLVEDASHHIPLERPESVVEAVRWAHSG
ncbi:alpha/beta hydrolase [Allokutzneria sp. A3M-2-11 16]|uniref:alpha/beta fold hydrolase n=1 Tax=Allokutzneria sp. A3M-2-11 16 TaxID=2962043 RepID=UPI0020B8F2DC|nr:alpha/beta hydrolase [Allokutzneria sp. A3M-2-11 16]MCP3802529.1 alpha/beta hydrolase [Allokutzneria sp. A3M-2-11 16]